MELYYYNYQKNLLTQTKPTIYNLKIFIYHDPQIQDKHLSMFSQGKGKKKTGKASIITVKLWVITR